MFIKIRIIALTLVLAMAAALPVFAQVSAGPTDIFPPWNIISPDMLSTRISLDNKVDGGPGLRLDTRLSTVVTLKELDLSKAAPGTDLNIGASMRPGDFIGETHIEIWLYGKDGKVTPLKDAAQVMNVPPPPWDKPVQPIYRGPWKDYTISYKLPEGHEYARAIFYLVVNGKGTLWFKSPGIASPEQLSTRISPDLDVPGGPATRIETGVPTVISVKEVKLKDRLHDTKLEFLANMRSRGFEGRAYLEMQMHYPSGAVLPVRSVQNPLVGNMDWYNYAVSYQIQKGEFPDKILLYLVVSGKGTIWLKSLKLQRNP
ncbi:MAG: hypothetical protein ACAH80_05865 [Alphaproteobacteria bacterium]